MTPTLRPRNPLSKRAFTLVELAVVIVALGIAVPPTLMWMDDAAINRTDAVQAARATALASAVLETVLADTSSRDPALGMPAFADSAAYLDTPNLGLRDRLREVTDLYATLGLSYTVTIGPLFDRDNAVNPNPAFNIYRTITVSVTFPSGRAGPASAQFSTVVSDL